MKRRQMKQWLIADQRLGSGLWAAVRKLPPGSGVLVLHHGLAQGERQRLLRRLRCVVRVCGLELLDEASGEAVRAHDVRELRRARLARTDLILLSPLYPTRSHPDWRPLAGMRAAALARLAGRRSIALGGMDAKRFSRVQRLVFQAWAGIDAFRT